MTIYERVERCGYTVEPVTGRYGRFNPLIHDMRISKDGAHAFLPARLYNELTDDVFERVAAGLFYIRDDWQPPRPEGLTALGIGMIHYRRLIDAAANTKPVQPKIEVTKYESFVCVSTEEYEEGTAFARTFQEWLALTPEQRAERHADAKDRRMVQFADAIAEWGALRERHADSPAVLAVLDIHHPDDDGRMECAHPVSGYEADSEDWPCTTYTAIKEATP